MRKLLEGLRPGDLNRMVSHRFTIDQYKSKMGNDKDIVVIAFRVADKFPAIDLMEFIEKGYPYVLDADISSGEERDGKYAVFVEFERSVKFPKQLDDLLRGVSQLCNCTNWRFRFFKDISSYEFNIKTIEEIVPLTPNEYVTRTEAQKVKAVSEVLSKGSVDIKSISEDNVMVVANTYGGDVEFVLESVGKYSELKLDLKGPLQLDQKSASQMVFLEKFLGNYEIHKIESKFLVRNDELALILSMR